MINNNKVIWPKSYTEISLGFTYILLLLFIFVFHKYTMPIIPILMFGFALIIFFFAALNIYTVRWQDLNSRDFTKKLFWHSFLYRLIFVGIMYLLTLWLDPNSFPFEIGAADAWNYHSWGIEVSKNLYNGKLIPTLYALCASRADFGFPTYLGFIYSIFGPHTFPVRLLNCLWGSMTVVYISKIARMVYSETQARLAGIISMLMLPFLWFGGMHLKETLMLFLVIIIFYQATKIVHTNRIKAYSIFSMATLSFLLFFFRTFLAIFVIICIVLYFLLNFSSQKANKPILFFSFVLFIISIRYLVIHYGFQEEIHQITATGPPRPERMLFYLTKQVGLSHSVEIKSATLFALLGSLVTPFPSLLSLEARQLGIYTHFQNEIVRNIMYFFAFWGIFYSLKNKLFRKVSLMLMFILGHTFILALSARAFYARFQLVSLPFMIIFMADGIKHSKGKGTKIWIMYLMLIMIAIFAWNMFKMGIRGLI